MSQHVPTRYELVEARRRHVPPPDLGPLDRTLTDDTSHNIPGILHVQGSPPGRWGRPWGHAAPLGDRVAVSRRPLDRVSSVETSGEVLLPG